MRVTTNVLGIRTERSQRQRVIATSFLAVLMAALAFATGCGTDSSSDGGESDGFVQVSDSGETYALSDLQAIGYKTSKTYDVDGLNDASEAYYGFWQSPSANGPVDYEVRIYPSHALAVSSGTAQAEEVVGDDAILISTNSTWPEGLTDRRVIVGGGSRGRSAPRYSDYVIVGNLVVLCQGRSEEQSQERCDDLVTALRS